MAVATIKLFIQQSLALQYADLVSAGVLVGRTEENYFNRTETYTFLGATFVVNKRLGEVVSITIPTTSVPTLA